MSKSVWLAALCALAILAPARASEVLPPAPERYFNDYAHVISPAVAARLNTDLENLEKTSSNQILVVIYPKMDTDRSIEDYCHSIFATLHVGQKGKDNGAVLFLFVQDHQMRIETNYGLEGALPDATCEDIISDVIAPRLKAGDFDGGVSAGVHAMIQATRGEYKGTGRTAHQGSLSRGGKVHLTVRLIVFLFGILASFVHIMSRIVDRRRSTMKYARYGPIFIDEAGIGGGGGVFGGGVSSGRSGGGGFFSSGGGSSGGGGGASGGW